MKAEPPLCHKLLKRLLKGLNIKGGEVRAITSQRKHEPLTLHGRYGGAKQKQSAVHRYAALAPA